MPCKPSTKSHPNAARMSKGTNLEALKAGASLETLEKLVQQGRRTLQILKNKLAEDQSPDESSARFIVEIDELIVSADELPKTIVGVVGATGAGKSSLINALLDQERLVPTSCMRACTSVATEISYNDDGRFAFRARLDFISRQDWEQELDLILSEMYDENGKVRYHDFSGEGDSPAAISYAKFKAVYMGPGGLTKDDLSQVSKEYLMGHERLSILGSQKFIKENSAKKFYDKLQSFIDATDNDDYLEEDEIPDTNQTQYWPLIEVVQIKIKHEILETGAVIVDLPGMQDSNAARANVARTKLAQCTIQWIVDPANRAVSSQIGRELLGPVFKRQLQMDNNIGNITFICSKTDDIKLNETTDTANMRKEFADYQKNLIDLQKQQKQVERAIIGLKRTSQDLREELLEVNDEIERLMETQDRQMHDGNLEAADGCLKRKRNSSNSDEQYTARVKRESAASGAHQEPTIKIKNPIHKLTQDKRQLREKTTEVNLKISLLETREQNLTKSMSNLEHGMRRKCILERNKLVKRRVQIDYANGVRETDEEVAEERDAANFDPSRSLRDYNAIRDDLKVFTVSALAYQKHHGRLEFEEAVNGFKDDLDTQIPQLQAHCKSLTFEKRRQALMKSLVGMFGILTSVELWARRCVSGQRAAEQRAIEASRIQKHLKTLNHTFGVQRQAVSECLKEVLRATLFGKLDEATATELAAKEARLVSPTVTYWATYKAICRRKGIFSNAKGHHDWNSEIVHPIMRKIGHAWEDTFQHKMPAVLDGFFEESYCSVITFHNNATSALIDKSSEPLLSRQLHTYKQLLKQACADAKEVMQQKQRESSRSIPATMRKELRGPYRRAANESGSGASQAMRRHIPESLTHRGSRMFNSCRSNAERMLEDAISVITDRLEGELRRAHQRASADYMAARANAGDPTITKANMRLGTEVSAITKQGYDQLESFIFEIRAASNQETQGRMSKESSHISRGKSELKVKDEQMEDDSDDGDVMLDISYTNATESEDEIEDAIDGRMAISEGETCPSEDDDEDGEDEEDEDEDESDVSTE